jgi:hypothetical protein
VSSDFKDVLRERVGELIKSRHAGVEAAITAAQAEITESLSRLVQSIGSVNVDVAGDSTLDQLSQEIGAQVGEAAAESSRLSGDLALLRDSVVDIDSQLTQADVLSVLAERAASFAPRVVLFVIKGQDAIGWSARGFNDEHGDQAVRGLAVSLESDTVLGSVVKASATFLGVPEDHADNALLLDRLGSVNPERIAGIPLRVRSKVAAVLYADTYDTSIGSISIEALELLVHSAAIIVELASLRQRVADAPVGAHSAVANASPYATVIAAPAVVLPSPPEPIVTFEAQPEPIPAAAEPIGEEIAPEESVAPEQAGGEVEYAGTFEESERSELAEPVAVEDAQPETTAAPFNFAWEPEAPPADVAAGSAPAFASPSESASESATPSPYEFGGEEPAPAEEPESGEAAFGASEAAPPALLEAVAPAAEPAAARRAVPPAPGELSQQDEKLHNDARRFARLLVSEIKLYNEQRVAEGRNNNDLYERLKDDIDRSRQMYEKRVDTSVAEQFDYFYDELLNTLAQGDQDKLGPDCPGPTV